MGSILKVRDTDGTVHEIYALQGKSAYQYAVEGGYTGTEAEFAAKLAKEKFANPNALTFAGAVTGSYDGSAAVTVEIPSGGGGDMLETAAEFEIGEEVASYTLDLPGKKYKQLLIHADIIGTASNSKAAAVYINVNYKAIYSSTKSIWLTHSNVLLTSADTRSVGVIVFLTDNYAQTFQSCTAFPGYDYYEKLSGLNNATPLNSITLVSQNGNGILGVGTKVTIKGVPA